jgi:hypothetical protein
MASGETVRAIRSVLFDVLEKCARHMDDTPNNRSFQPVAYAVHAAMEDFERQFAQASLDEKHQEQLFIRAQDMALEWLLTIQDLQREASLPEGLETLPTWDGSPQGTGEVPKTT